MQINNAAFRRGFLEQMPTLELDEMLQAELQKESIDDDLVRLILEVLEQREKGYPLEVDEKVSEAVTKYTAYLDELKAAPSQPARKWSAVLKAASILLVIGLLVFAAPQAANAEGFFGLLARWTDSIFEFFNPGNDHTQPDYVFETDHPGLQQIYDAVVDLGVTDPVVPMWIPNEYELSKINVDEWPAEETVYAEFRNTKNSITISIILHNNEIPYQHAKDPQNVQECEIAGIQHYIFTNRKKITSTWVTKNIECVIVTDCQEDIHKILKSIYAMGVQK